MIAGFAGLARRYELSTRCQQDILVLFERICSGMSVVSALIAPAPVDLGDCATMLLERTIDTQPTIGATQVDELGSEPEPTGLVNPVERPVAANAAERYTRSGAARARGMGEVRRVRDPNLNRTMAMKTIPPTLLGRVDADLFHGARAGCLTRPREHGPSISSNRRH